MNDPSRVLIVEPLSDGGGLWHYACCVARGLAAAGFEVMLAASAPFEPLDIIGNLPLRVISREPEATRIRPLLWLRRAMNQVSRAARLREIVREFRPDIVHVHDPIGRLDFAYFRYLKWCGARVVYTAHEAPGLWTRLEAPVEWFDRARYAAAEMIFVHCRTTIDALVALGVDGAKIRRIEHGSYVDFCAQSDMPGDRAKSLLGIPPTAPAVLFFGAIVPYKGVDVLIDAFSKLHAWDRRTYLIVAGLPGEDITRYRAQIERLGLTDRVVLDPRYIPFSEFPRYFRAADVVAFPYRRVHQSGVLQLAYAYRRPVVVSDVGGLCEAVTDDRTGLVAPVGDPDALAAAIRRLLSDRPAAEAMGKRGRRLAETKYSWRVITGEIARAYRSLRISRRATSPAG